MFRNQRVSSGFFAVLSLGAVVGLPAFALTPPAFMVSDGSGDSVTIDSSGTPPTCTGTCSTSSVSVGSGTVTWSGTVGVFVVSLNGTANLTSPQIDFSLVPGVAGTGVGNNGTGTGTLTIEWSDTGFTGAPGSASMSESTGTSCAHAAPCILGSVSVIYRSYVDNTNTLFGTGTLVNTIGPVTTVSSASATGSGATTNPYSMTEVETITMGVGGRLYGGDDSLTVTPVPPGTTFGKGDTATIGFWHNKNGQALIDSLNGGSSSTALVTWLTSNFPKLYGSLGLTDNASVAAQFLTFFDVSGQKTQAQILGTALACYVTSSTLAGGNVAASQGFNVTPAGICGDLFNVGSDGSAIGLSNNTSYTILFLLQTANNLSPFTTAEANAFNDIFSNINQTGDI